MGKNSFFDSFMVEPESSGDYYDRILTVPNAVTFLGIMLGLLNFWLIYAGFAVIFAFSVICLISDVLMGITDLADGKLARILKQKSWLGIILDPIRDSMIVVNLVWHYGVLAGYSAINHPLLWIALALEALAGAGGLIVGMSYEVSSHFVGKFRRVIQVGILFVLVSVETFGVSTESVLSFAYSVIAFSSAISFVSYVFVNREKIWPSVYIFLAQNSCRIPS